MSNAETHRRSVDHFNKRDWDSFTGAYAAECEYVDQARSFTAKGREQVLEFEQGWVTAYPDAASSMAHARPPTPAPTTMTFGRPSRVTICGLCR